MFCLLFVLSGMAAAAQPDHESQVWQRCSLLARPVPVVLYRQLELPVAAKYLRQPAALVAEHGLLRCTSTSASQGTAMPIPRLQCMDQLLKELAGSGNGAGGSNPFKAFARRAALVITGLVHISVLLLPRQHDTEGGGSSGGGSAGAPAAGKGSGGKGGGASGSGAGSSRGPAGGAGGGSGGDPAAELAAAGFPSDGSNLEEWQRVSWLDVGGCVGRGGECRGAGWRRVGGWAGWAECIPS